MNKSNKGFLEICDWSSTSLVLSLAEYNYLDVTDLICILLQIKTALDLLYIVNEGQKTNDLYSKISFYNVSKAS